jgi:hypothetical protein
MEIRFHLPNLGIFSKKNKINEFFTKQTPFSLNLNDYNSKAQISLSLLS